jgi:hypothetical protein
MKTGYNNSTKEKKKGKWEEKRAPTNGLWVEHSLRITFVKNPFKPRLMQNNSIT